MRPISRFAPHRSLLAAVLLFALSSAAPSQAPAASYVWAQTNFLFGSNADSGVYLSMSRDTASGAAWFVPARVSEWCDSLGAALFRAAAVTAAPGWSRFGNAMRSADNRAGIRMLRWGGGDTAIYRIGFDDGGMDAAISVDLTFPQFRQFVTSMRGSADQAAKRDASASPTTYFEYQVTKPAMVKGNLPIPKWPASLQGVVSEGSVTVQFVVDTMGKADMSTFKVIVTSNMQFADEVRRVIALYTFYPAEVGGRRVAQYVQLPFVFKAVH